MDGRTKLFYISILLLSCYILYASAIQCYLCNSYDDKGCADYFNNHTYSIERCPEDAKLCRKIVQETYYEGEWHMRYVRQCAREGELENLRLDWHCFDKIGTYRVKVKYCHCRVDGCNSASKTGFQYSTILFSLLVTLAYFNK